MASPSPQKMLMIALAISFEDDQDNQKNEKPHDNSERQSEELDEEVDHIQRLIRKNQHVFGLEKKIHLIIVLREYKSS